MLKTFLSWFGLLALVGLVGASVAGLLLVKDRVQLVVQDANTPDARAQQVAQLRDELTQVQRDVQALAAALGKGLQQLAEDDASDVAHRHAELLENLERCRENVRSLTQEVRATGEPQQALAASVGRLENAVRDLERTTAGGHPAQAPTDSGGVTALAAPPTTGAPRPPQAPPENTPVGTQQAAASGNEPAATPPESPASPTAVAPTGEGAPRKRSAFAFSLPSQSFTFDLRQRFELLPSLSRVGFDAKSTLHDFTGVTSKLSGAFALNLAKPTDGCSGEIRVDARALDTGLPGRNDAMREHLAAEQWPEIVFTLQGMTADGVDPVAQTVRGTVRGQMTIRGKTRDVEMAVELTVDASKRINAKGEMPLKLSDYEVPVPSQLGMIKMQDEVKVWIALQARALGKETAR